MIWVSYELGIQQRIPWWYYPWALPMLLADAIFVLVLWALRLIRMECGMIVFGVPVMIFRQSAVYQRWMDLLPDAKIGGQNFGGQCLGLAMILRMTKNMTKDLNGNASKVPAFAKLDWLWDVRTEREEMRHTIQMLRDGPLFPITYAKDLIVGYRSCRKQGLGIRKAWMESYALVGYELDGRRHQNIDYREWSI
jgi:hypothetical protein